MDRKSFITSLGRWFILSVIGLVGGHLLVNRDREQEEMCGVKTGCGSCGLKTSCKLPQRKVFEDR